MKKQKKKMIYSSVRKIFPIIIFMITVLMSIGYASINSIIIGFDGEVVAKDVDGVFITDVEYMERNDSLPNESYTALYLDKTVLKSSIILEPNDINSEVSLKVTFYNSNNYDYVFKDVIYAEELTDDVDDLYSNSNIIYTFTNQNEVITKNGGTLEVIITFKYSEVNESISNILNSILNFKFSLASYIVDTFEYTGNYETFVVPHNGVYKIELWGAQGGPLERSDLLAGGYGAYTSGEIYLTENDELYIYVGDYGYMPNNVSKPFNGGGAPDTTGTWEYSYSGSYSGGGATDIRLVDGDWDNFESLKSRIMVAAGGSGGNNNDGTTGGAGGGLFGLTTSNKALVVVPTQSTGFSFGIGQDSGVYPTQYVASDGGTYTIGADTGAGGGGYYGGYRGYSHNSGGSSGSSFISGHNGCDAILESSTKDNIIHTGQSVHYSGYQFINTVMIDGNGYNWTTEIGNYIGMPTYDGISTMTGNKGHGYAKITYLKDA